jgi:hypothetical protein
MDRLLALVNAVMNLWVPQNMGSLLTSWRSVSFSERTLLHRVNYLVSSLVSHYSVWCNIRNAEFFHTSYMCVSYHFHIK